MAAKDLFKEVKNALSNYSDEHYYQWVKEQSERYVTRMHYTNKWCIHALTTNFFKAAGKYGVSLNTEQSKELKDIIEKKVRATNNVNNWTRALDPDFTIVPATQKTDLDGTVQIMRHKDGVEARFHKSFTMGEYKGQGLGKIPDRHENAQKRFFEQVAEHIIGDIQHSDKFDMSQKNAFFTMDNPAKGNFRLHAGDLRRGMNDGTEYKSDTTVRLIDFLEDIGKKDFDEILRGSDEFTKAEAKSVQERINKEFNAGFSIDGLSKIDLFDGRSPAEKNIAIKVVFGHSSKNSLASAADKGQFKAGDKRLDGFFAKLEEDLLNEFAKDPGKEASLSMQEMMRRGVFAKIAKEMKTASGMPDMRFKINKQLYKEAKYKDKTKDKSGVKLVRNKKTTLKTTRAKVGKFKGRAAPEMRTEQSPLALEALLNELLPKVVASKMTSPALNYRTGRFANSARVEDVMVGPRGGLAINYTYMRDPYETFEPGNAQGSTQRDPRKILGESVREIAQSIVGDKFLTVRRV